MLNLTLKSHRLSRYDEGNKFPLGDLNIKITGFPNYANAEYRLIGKLNKREIIKATISEMENVVEVPVNELSTGEFEAEVAVYIKGNLVETLPIEPLTITDVDGSFFAEPLIDSLKLKAEEQTKKIAELEERQETLIKTLGIAMDNIEYLYEFGRTCITKIPFINNIEIKENKS